MATLRPRVDAFVLEEKPSENRGEATKLRLDNTGGSTKLAYIFFGRPFPLGASVREGYLRLRTATAWSGQTLKIRRVTERWQEDGVHWTSRPLTVGTSEVVVALTAGADTVVEVNIGGILSDWAAGAECHGLRLETTSTSEKAFYSSDEPHESWRPEVDIEWGEAPDAPTITAPTGGQAVGTTTPVGRWEFEEPGTDAEQEQSSSQVQVSTSAAEAGITYDSGKVANTENAYALAGIAAASTRWWRVKAWDENDEESAWSEWHEFEHVAKGTITITSPAATTADLSPPINWTVTGATQESWELWLWRQVVGGYHDGEWKLALHRPRKVGADTSYTVPADGTIESGVPYRAELRVWDTVDRATTQGDVPYITDTQDFTYARSGAPAAVATLVATPVEDGVQLVWTRSAQPDYFSVRVNGRELKPRIDPDDVFQGGTTYQMTFHGATPGTEHTYEVEAVVLTGGVFQHSDGNATDTATWDPIGIWLIDEDDGTSVRIEGTESSSFGIREVGTTFDVLGSRRPVRITDAVMGYAGDVQGSVWGPADRDTFLDLKGRLKRLRLVLSGLNLKVVLEEVTANPTPMPGRDLYQVGLAFFQAEEPDFDVKGL